VGGRAAAGVAAAGAAPELPQPTTNFFKLGSLRLPIPLRATMGDAAGEGEGGGGMARASVKVPMVVVHAWRCRGAEPPSHGVASMRAAEGCSDCAGQCVERGAARGARSGGRQAGRRPDGQ
jgi:hypothetical protein